MRARILAAALGAAALLALAGCGGSGDGSTSSNGTTTSTAAAAPKRVDLDVENGKINGGGPPHVTFDKGDAVALHVTADVSDEVHVHGYDLHGDVAPGKPVTIQFAADVPGRFEAELESRSLQILQFTVNP